MEVLWNNANIRKNLQKQIYFPALLANIFSIVVTLAGLVVESLKSGEKMKVDKEQIRLWWQVMKTNDKAVELRILPSSGGKVESAIMSSVEAIIQELEGKEEAGVKGVYFTLNPLVEECKSLPQYGRFLPNCRAVDDTMIAHRDWLLVDIDPTRPSGVSATEDEKKAAEDVAQKIIDELPRLPLPEGRWCPNPRIVADSGNGYHLIWEIDTPNTPEALGAVNLFLRALSAKYSTTQAEIDTSVGNASRICKLYGTTAHKGPGTPDRPHRMAKILNVCEDDEIEPLFVDDLVAIARHLTPQEEIAPPAPKSLEYGQKNGEIGALLEKVESCIGQLEAKRLKIPADRAKWHAITCGFYHSLGEAGVEAFLRFSALWENSNPKEDREKYLEVGRYPREDGASIGSFFDFCKEWNVTPAYPWRRLLVNIEDEPPAPRPLITRDGQIFLSRGNLAAIVGKPKCGKSTILSAIVSCAYSGKECLGFESAGGLRVVWFDTEQGADDSARVWRRVYQLAGQRAENTPQLRFLRLLEVGESERMACIKSAISELHPDIAVIDGIGDLAKDTNDLKESERIITALRRINVASDCGMVVILHTNPRDDKARGHLGTILQQKAETICLLNHIGEDDSPVEVRPQYTRKAPWKKFTFEIDGETGLPVEGMEKTPPALSIILGLMKEGRVYTHSELLALAESGGVGTSSAKKYISKGAKEGRIEKVNEGYRLPPEDLPA